MLIALGQVAVAAGDRSAATEYFEEATRLTRANGLIHSIAWSLYEAAKVYRDEGRYAEEPHQWVRLRFQSGENEDSAYEF